MITNDVLAAWGGGQLLRRLNANEREDVWLVNIAGKQHVLRKIGCGEPSAVWLNKTLRAAQTCGIVVPQFHRANFGAISNQGWTVETYFPGKAGRPRDLADLDTKIHRFHLKTRGFADRPNRPPVFKSGQYPRPILKPRTGKLGVIHGDLHPGNLIRTSNGQIAIIDWTESRKDYILLDRLAMNRDYGNQVLMGAELMNCWRSEPAYTRALARKYARFNRPVPDEAQTRSVRMPKLRRLRLL